MLRKPCYSLDMKYLFGGATFGIVLISWLLFFNGSPTATNVPSNGTTIVAFGDSLVAGVGAREGNNFVDLLSQQIQEPIINLGVSGNTTRDGLIRLDTVLAQDPKIVLLLLGGNDYLQKIPEAETFANLETVIETIHESGSAVLLLGIRGGILRDNFKSRFEDLAKKHNTAYVSNVLDGLFGNQTLMSDTIHPNDSGYQIIADRIYPVLNNLLKNQ